MLDPLFEERAAPNLEQLFLDGTDGELESQIPPWTPSAWPSVYTGRNPGQHGVFGFLAYDGYDWDIVNATHVRARPFWKLLEYHDLTSVVVNAPVTHPPAPLRGAMVPGYMAPQQPTCHPPELLSELQAAIGEYRVYPVHSGGGGAPRREMIDEYRTVVGMRGDAFRYLDDRFDPEFGFVQFQQTDTVFHELPDDGEAVRAVYEAVDDEIGAILEHCEPDTVIVVSDHGIGRYGGVEFRVNEFLRRQGFVETKRGGRGMPSWAPIRDTRLMGGSDSTAGILERAVTAFARVGVTSQRVERALDRVGLAGVVASLVPTRLIRAGTEQVDFANSRAYMRSRIEVGVRINLAGREPEGTVPRSEYEPVRSRLVELLLEVRTPAGEPVFEDVAPREEYFHGGAIDDAVDVVTVPADFDHFLSATLAGDEFGEPTEPWNHKMAGVVAAAGTAVDPASEPEDATIFDVAPTVLAALGVDYDREMDGTPLPFVEPTGARRYPEYGTPDEVRTDSSTVEGRLRDLGYLG